MNSVERVETNGHLVLVHAVSAGDYGANKGVYSWEITINGYVTTPTGHISTSRTRAGLVLPRPGSTYAEVKTDIFVVVRDGMSGDPGKFTVVHWDFEPNIVFGADADYTAVPDEKDADALAKDVARYEAWEKAEAAKNA